MENKITFLDYTNKIKQYFNYLEIDGALINNTKEDRNIEIEKPILAYKEITFKNNTCQLDETNITNKIINIPAHSVVFFQTKIKGPNIQLNKNNFDKKILSLNEIKEELAAVLYKMIIYNKYFYELYIKLGLIDEKYTSLFFLIFDDYPISNISVYIKNYLDIFIDKKLLTYNFIIQPIYMSAYIEEVNSKLNMIELNNSYMDKIKNYEELTKNEKLKKQKRSAKRKEGGNKIKEEEEKKEIIAGEEEIKNKEEEIRRRENELKNKEEEIKRREEELKKKEIDEEIKRRENELFIKNIIKECDSTACNLANSIRKNVEEMVGCNFKKYKPIGYNYKLIDNIECYSFKVKIDKNKYIHILKKGEKINVIFGKTLFEPF